MHYRYLQIVYLNFLIIAFALLNMPLLALLFFLLKPSYLIWKNSFEPLFFLAINEEIDDEWLTYIDYDTDSNYYFKNLKGEFYLWFGCYFIFHSEGGDTILHDLDFLDIIMYNMFDKKNFKYIYKSIDYKVEYNKSNYFYLYQYNRLYVKNYNLKHNLKLFNKNTFNILSNTDKIERLNNIKKYYYYKKC
jgi:hypothetical protein